MPEFTDEEKRLIRKLGVNVDFENLTDDDCIEIEDRVGTAYSFEAMDYPDKWTSKLMTYGSIIDKLSAE